MLLLNFSSAVQLPSVFPKPQSLTPHSPFGALFARIDWRFLAAAASLGALWAVRSGVLYDIALLSGFPRPADSAWHDVYPTGFAVYFETDELKRKPWLYALCPPRVVSACARFKAPHFCSSCNVAVFHFAAAVLGVALYRARAGER